MNPELENDNLINVVNALPSHFEFYHLGKVTQQSSPCEFQDKCSVLFRIYGDIQAWIILVFESDLDFSVYSELGNLLVSQIANQLSSRNGLDVMITPPQLLREDQAIKITENSPQLIRKNYAHFYKNSTIPIETLIVPTPIEGPNYV